MKIASVALALAFASASSFPQDKTPSPPYLVSSGHHYIVGVAWNEEALKLLPPGLKATSERTGGLNIIQAEHGYGLTPYHSGYIWIDLDGHDSADGSKARYVMKAGIGSEQSAALVRTLFQGADIVPGDTRLQDMGEIKRGTGIRNGQEWVQVEIKSSNECQKMFGTLNYPVSGSQMIQIPWGGDGCKAEPVSAKLMLPSGEKGSGLQPAKLLWALELNDSRYALTIPVAMK